MASPSSNSGSHITETFVNQAPIIGAAFLAIMVFSRIVLMLVQSPLYYNVLNAAEISQWIAYPAAVIIAVLTQGFIGSCSLDTFVNLGSNRKGSAFTSLIFSAIFVAFDLFILNQLHGWSSVTWLFASMSIVSFAAELRAYLLSIAKN